MILGVEIESDSSFLMDAFLRELDLSGAVFACSSEDEEMTSHYFYFEGSSTTMFVIDVEQQRVTLGIDGLASWDDYKRFPYILDVLSVYLTGARYSHEGKSAFQIYDEDWIAESMGEEIAYLKAWLSSFDRYDVSLPLVEDSYVTKELLREYGVCLHSSTPRIYGYIHYLMAYDSLPSDPHIGFPVPEQDELDVPQHVSIGKVKSWMLDGSETWESYSREDVDLLLEIAGRYREGDRSVKGVVLNDIGTIYQMGVGVGMDGEEAAYWFQEGYNMGDHWFSPTNLGDIYRKGCGNLPPDLEKAFNAYSLSEDPYSWYRIGQAWEEGWIAAEKDLNRAIAWYEKAADARHHLAIKALERLRK